MPHASDPPAPPQGDTTTAPQPPEDRYVTTGELGRGGMGVTYASTDTETGEEVVLKRLDVSRMADWKALELFRREARVLRHLDHPGIPRYVDAFEDEETGTFTLVQARAPGKSLRAWVEAGWRPSEVEAWNLADQLLDILVYLQRLNPSVIHRDLKPENIVRDDEGRVMLVDFGAVRDVYVQTITGGSTIIGTFGYMAPEQLQGRADLTTDLYGLGTTLLFCLTGEEPSALPQVRMRFDLSTLDPIFAGWLGPLVEPMPDDRTLSAEAAVVAREHARHSPQELARVRWHHAVGLLQRRPLRQWGVWSEGDEVHLTQWRARTAIGPGAVVGLFLALALVWLWAAASSRSTTLTALALVVVLPVAGYWLQALLGDNEIRLGPEAAHVGPRWGTFRRQRRVARGRIAALDVGHWTDDGVLKVYDGNRSLDFAEGDYEDRRILYDALSTWAGITQVTAPPVNKGDT